MRVIELLTLRKRLRPLAAVLTVVPVLVSCGGDSSDEPLPRNPEKPAERKQPTLSAAEYPLMREWAVSEPDEAAELQPLCEELDAGPDTPVIRATRNACDRTLSIFNDVESVGEDLESTCALGGFEACADAMEPLGRQIVDFRRTVITYNDEIADAVASGPCREALQAKEQLEEIDRFLGEFEQAVRELRLNNPEPLQDLDTDFDSGLDDLTPCRPA